MSQQAQAVLQAQQKTVEPTSTKGSTLQRAALIPAITPVHNPILQRCSGGVECEECRQKRLGTIQRAAVNSAPVNENGVPPIVHETLNSPGQPLDAGTRAFMEPRFGYDFSQVRVHTDVPRIFPNLIIAASPETPQEVTPPVAVNAPVSNSQPFTAFPLEARTETESCGVPSGQHGATKAIRFRIADFDGQPVNSNLTVSEKFSRLEGPDDVYKKLSRGSKQAEKGFFNDCYRLFQPTPLPEDLRLKVEQNHLIDNEIISKNHITYTPTSVMVCVFPRHARERDFGSKCKIF